MADAWRSLKAGNRVRVTVAVSATEEQLLGREFTVNRLANNGYAVIADENGSKWWVHPESLEIRKKESP